jgi:hypothetical protein
MRIRGVIVLIIGMFLLNFASANFQIGNLSHSIETQYSLSEAISGWINISLNEESANSLFTDLNNNNITLLKLIKQNSNLEYSCFPKNCTSSYSSEGSEKTTISFDLNSGQKKLIGIKLGGNINSINSLNLSVSSNAEASCYSQLEIDILNDGSIEYMNQEKSLSSNSCDSLLDRGCFVENKPFEQEYGVAKFPQKHCQKITFSPSPNFRIGAWIRNPNNEVENITMGVHYLNMTPIQSSKCNLPSITGNGTYYCEIEQSVKEPTQYFVCIYASKTTNFKLRGYNDDKSGCGFYQNDSQVIPEKNAAFDIFAQGLGFDPVGDIIISDSSGGTMSKIKDYIYNQYGTYDCGQEMCIVPILINSRATQHVTLENLEVKYTTDLGTTNTNKMYSIQETPPKISSKFQKIFINYGNFTTPSKYGKAIVQINLNGSKIFSENISVRNIPTIKSLYPLIASSIISTNFVVYVNSSKNITEYSWDFNDSTPIQKTTSNIVKHTYNKSGSYYVTVKVKDSEGINVSKTFNVLATIPIEQIESELENKLNMLNRVKSSLSPLDSFVQEGLNSVLNTRGLENEIKSLQKSYSFASSEEDYNRIVINISRLEVPEVVAITKKFNSLPFYPSLGEINLEVIQDVGGRTKDISGKEEEYKNALLGWQVENANVKVSIEEYSAIINNAERAVLTKFRINVEKNYSEKPIYLFIRNMKDLNFKENYLGKESGNYLYWMLNENTKEIEFITTESVSYETLPVFISPEISVLEVSEKIDKFIKNVKAKIGIISFSLLILIILALIVYTILSIWYKRKYESYLFKERNDLYNLISYVNISKKSGEKEENMRSNLKKSGWTGEQITYVLKKYSGKRTGMIELPLTKLVDWMMGYNQKAKPISQDVNKNINPRNRSFFNRDGKVL